MTENIIHQVEQIASAVKSGGGRAFYVGGFVRDRLLGLKPKDIDIEVYGLTGQNLLELLEQYGRVDLIGKQFGVFRVRGVDAEFALPRSDSSGRKPEVVVDPSLDFKEATRRRDLTVNAILMDVLGGEIIDPWRGQDDLKNKLLRAPDPERFIEDPLRYYRVMQFLARFEMRVDESLDSVCRSMPLDGVAAERVAEEFEKLLLFARRPSLGLCWLKDNGRLGEILPELAPLPDTPQEPDWHPEGDVWRHTMQAVDAAARLRESDRIRDLKLMWAALCHDLGKPETTVLVEGRIRTPDHDRKSVLLAELLLERLVFNREIRNGVLKLVAHHMKPMQFHSNESSPKAFKRLALKLSPEADLHLLGLLARADYHGTNPDADYPHSNESMVLDWFDEQVVQLGVEREPEKPLLLGRHLMGVVSPGPRMGAMLEEAYRIQLEEGIREIEELKRRVIR